MPRSLSLGFCAVLLAVSPVLGRTEYRLGGADGVPWQQTLSVGPAGAYVVLGEDGQQLGEVAVRTAAQESGTDTLIDFSGTSIRPRFFDPSVNLALADLNSEDTEVLLPSTGGEVSVTYDGDGTSTYLCYFKGMNAPFNKRMLDGDPVTAQFRGFVQHPDRPPGSPLGPAFMEGIIFDFGADVPINRVRFYPRLSRVEDALLIRNFSAPKPDPESFGVDSFADNFLAWLDIRVGDNSLPFQNGPCSRVPGRRWMVQDDPLLKLLYSTRENLDVVTDLRFPTQSIRFLMLQMYPLRSWEIAEFEIYGDGFAQEATYLTQILDFGKPINWGKIRWQGAAPAGTRVEIRTRTGRTPDPNLYFAPNVNGDLSRITLEEYIAIDALARRPTVYDAENWSFWSPPYDFGAGLRDASHPAATWADGTPLLAAGPRRYLQIAVKFFATPQAAPQLDQLALQFGEVPAAQEVLGEIWPIQIDTFAPTTFTYVVLPTFDPQDSGFDRLEILTHTRVETIRSVLLDGVEVDRALHPPETQDDRIVVAFPKLRGEKDSFKQLEVVFDAPVLRFGTEFSSWVFDSDDPARIKQQVKPGNATYRFSGDELAVKTPVGGKLLVDLEVAPSTITPNGDGVNDRLRISYKLREVSLRRPLTVRIYDLAGRLVAALPPLGVRSGEFRQQWDGRDGAGRLVPPGTYLFKLALGVEDELDQTGFISVAY